jgi:hypothetical protein
MSCPKALRRRLRGGYFFLGPAIRALGFVKLDCLWRNLIWCIVAADRT